MAACVLRRTPFATVNKHSVEHVLTNLNVCLSNNERPQRLCLFSSLFVRLSCFQQKRHMSSRLEKKVLETVGVFEALKQQGRYETGQLFLHNVFGYRGIVLFPWHARLYDRDIALTTTESSPEPPGVQSFKELSQKTHAYYQVLIDARDCPYISQRAQTEAVTFLARHDDNKGFYAIPGLDYVCHEDILPYSSTDCVPIKHHLFERFLQFNSSNVPPFIPTDVLQAWQKTTNQWLELSDVHRETTEKIRVTVIPFYMGMREQDTQIHWWRYSIRLENMGDEVVRLRERHWRIFSISGTLETVRGRGVVGQEPVLTKEQPAFQYSSHVSLQAPSGHMWGTFTFQRASGAMFEVVIPSFSLDSHGHRDSPYSFLC